MNRWVPIMRTTPSGKQQFVCLCCGRVSIAPDKTCVGGPVPTPLYGPVHCHEWEQGPTGENDLKMAARCIDHLAEYRVLCEQGMMRLQERLKTFQGKSLSRSDRAVDVISLQAIRSMIKSELLMLEQQGVPQHLVTETEKHIDLTLTINGLRLIDLERDRRLPLSGILNPAHEVMRQAHERRRDEVEAGVRHDLEIEEDEG